VSVTKRQALKPKEWEHYVRQSYELIKSKLPKKTQREIG
jgi:predicted DNA-binding protein (MmcQ/YjbR family)